MIASCDLNVGACGKFVKLVKLIKRLADTRALIDLRVRLPLGSVSTREMLHGLISGLMHLLLLVERVQVSDHLVQAGRIEVGVGTASACGISKR
jgi:hypothetical protein